MEKEVLTIWTLGTEGGQDVKFHVTGDGDCELRSYTVSSSRMGVTRITCDLKHRDCLDSYWTGREYVEWRGMKYFLLHVPSSRKDNTDERYVHTLEFQSGRDITLGSVYFYDAVDPEYAGDEDRFVSGSTKVYFFGTLEEFVGRFNAVLAYRGLDRYVVSIDEGVGDTEAKYVSFEDLTLFEVLQQAYDIWGVPFYFDGDDIVFGDGSDLIEDVDFEYGVDEELLSVRKENANAKIVTRCTGFGSSENIPYYYPNPTPKGTLAVGGTAQGVSIVDQLKFSALGENESLTWAAGSISSMDLSYSIGGDETEEAVDGEVPLDGGQKTGKMIDVSMILDVTVTSRTNVRVRVDSGILSTCSLRFNDNLPWTATRQYYLGDVVYVMRNLVRTDYINIYHGTTPIGTNTTDTRYWKILTSARENDTAIDMGRGFVGFVPTQVRRHLREAQYGPLVPFGGESGSYILPSSTGNNFSGSKGISFAYVKAMVFDTGELDPGTYEFYINGHLVTAVSDPNVNIWSSPVQRTGGLKVSIETMAVGQPVLKNGSGRTVTLAQYGLSQSGSPVIGTTITQVVTGKVKPSDVLMPPVFRTSEGAERFYNALNDTYPIPGTEDEYYEFSNEYNPLAPREHIQEFEDIRPTIKNVTNALGQHIDTILAVAFDEGYNTGDADADGNYRYTRFFVKLPAFDGSYGFNLFDSANEKGEMEIEMTSGACGACRFQILVNDKGKNTVQVDGSGNLLRDSEGRVLDGAPQDAQNDTRLGPVWVKLGLDESTYGGRDIDGGVMPSWNAAAETGFKPSAGDTYVITNISLPQAYILAAENELKEAIIKFMAENNSEKYKYSISFSRVYLAQNPTLRDRISAHSSLMLTYDGVTLENPLYVSDYSYKAADGTPLPEISVELNDIIEAATSGLEQKIDSSVKEGVKSAVAGLSPEVNFDHLDGRYLRRDVPESVKDAMNFLSGISIGDYLAGMGGRGGGFSVDENGNSHLDADYLNVRRKLSVSEFEIEKVSSVGGRLVISPSSMLISSVEVIDREVEGVTYSNAGYKCYYNRFDNDGNSIECSFMVGDLAICQSYNQASTQYYWREVVEAGEGYVVLGNLDEECDPTSMPPLPGDVIVQLGSRTDASRSSAQILSCYGDNAPSIIFYTGIDSFSLTGKDVFGVVYHAVLRPGGMVYEPLFYNFGSMYLGDRQESGYIRWDDYNKRFEVKGVVNVSPSGDSSPSPVDRGPYVQGRTYYWGDTVTYNGTTYMHYSEQPSTTAPTDTTKWRVYAQGGTSGTDGVSVFLSTTSVIAEMEQGGGRFATELFVIEGGTRKTTGITIGTITGLPDEMEASVSDMNIYLDYSDHMAETSGEVTIPVTYKGQTYNLKYAWAIAQPGATGQDAVIYYLTTDVDQITRDVNNGGVLTPSSMSITVWRKIGSQAATKYNPGYLRYNRGGTTWNTSTSSTVTLPISKNTVSGDVVKLQITNNTTGTVVYFSKNIPVVNTPESGYRLEVTHPIFTIPCDAEGQTLPGIDEQESEVALYKGNTPQYVGVTYEYIGYTYVLANGMKYWYQGMDEYETYEGYPHWWLNIDGDSVYTPTATPASGSIYIDSLDDIEHHFAQGYKSALTGVTFSGIWVRMTTNVHIDTDVVNVTAIAKVDGDEVAKTTVVFSRQMKGAKGDMGLQGATPRGITDLDAELAEGRAFYNGIATSDFPEAYQFIDLGFHDDNGTIRYYKCKNSFLADMGDIPWGDGTDWEEASYYEFLFAKLLFAQAAYIDILSGKSFRMIGSNGDITAGMQGGTGINFWAGSDNPGSAPFRVNYNGDLHASRLYLSGYQQVAYRDIADVCERVSGAYKLTSAYSYILVPAHDSMDLFADLPNPAEAINGLTYNIIIRPRITRSDYDTVTFRTSGYMILDFFEGDVDSRVKNSVTCGAGFVQLVCDGQYWMLVQASTHIPQ